MNEKTYGKIKSKILSYKYGVKILKGTNMIITSLVYCLYPILLIVLAYNSDIRLWRVLIVPGLSFIFISMFRKYYNAPRPYEVLDIIPIIEKDSKGNSFPSRHVFSIFIIAMAFYYINPIWGILLMILGAALATTRVLGGVHFPRDVIAGAIMAIVGGIIGFVIL